MVSDGFQRDRQNGTYALVGSYDFYNNHCGWCDLPYPEIDLTYDSASPSATVVGDIVVSLVVLLFALSLLLLLPRMYIAWWNNRAPSFLEKTIALVVLVTPLGLPVYYWLVFRRMDHDGQYRLF